MAERYELRWSNRDEGHYFIDEDVGGEGFSVVIFREVAAGLAQRITDLLNLDGEPTNG